MGGGTVDVLSGRGLGWELVQHLSFWRPAIVFLQAMKVDVVAGDFD
jgi:hypothetical protein